MTFFFSDTVVLLFDFWSVHSPTGLALSLLVVALLSVLYEVVKMGKARVLRQGAAGRAPQPEPRGAAGARGGGRRPRGHAGQRRWFQFHVAQTLLHVVQVVLGYALMLAVMSYNAWVFLGVLAGSTVGYFVVYPLLRVG
nr:probable low affinity copper uptake protein 2 isoform X2 [Anas platyrhynchos]